METLGWRLTAVALAAMATTLIRPAPTRQHDAHAMPAIATRPQQVAGLTLYHGALTSTVTGDTGKASTGTRGSTTGGWS